MIAKIKLNDVYGDNINTKFHYVNIGNDYTIYVTNRDLIQMKYAQHFKNLLDGKINENDDSTNALAEAEVLAMFEFSASGTSPAAKAVKKILNSESNTKDARTVIDDVCGNCPEYTTEVFPFIETEPSTNYNLVNIRYFDQDQLQEESILTAWKDIYIVGNDGKTIDVISKNTKYLT